MQLEQLQTALLKNKKKKKTTTPVALIPLYIWINRAIEIQGFGQYLRR